MSASITQFVSFPAATLDDAAFRRLGVRAQMVYVYLRSYSDAAGKPVWPGQETLAERMGCSQRAVRRAWGELRQSGLISFRADRRGWISFDAAPGEVAETENAVMLQELGLSRREAEELLARYPTYATPAYIKRVVSQLKQAGERGIKRPLGLLIWALKNGELKEVDAAKPLRAAVKPVQPKEDVMPVDLDALLQRLRPESARLIGKNPPAVRCSGCGKGRWHQSALQLSVDRVVWNCSTCNPVGLKFAAAEIDLNAQVEALL